MNGLIDWLKGKKTYAMVIIAFIYGGGIQVGLWPHNASLDIILGGCTMATLRAGVAKGITPLLLACLLPFAVGCATIQKIATVNLPFTTTEAQLAGSAVLKFAVSDADRDEIAAMVYYAGDVMSDYTGANVPTADEFKAMLEAEGIGKLAKYQPIIEQFTAAYAARVPTLTGNPKLANDVIHALALGAKLSAAPYVHDASITAAQ